MTAPPHLIILTGVAGSGKTTIGKALARRLDYRFYDGDDFHSPQNVAKMARGDALDDADRGPWLARLHALLVDLHARNESAVIACSALKNVYRQRLTRDLPDVTLVYLKGSFELIHSRLQARDDHFFDPTLVQSQFDALEPPAPHEALHVDIDTTIEAIVAAIIEKLPGA
jgi:gluconokinase